MDSLHEAHLARILEARRRRGVLGAFCELVATPSARKHADGMMSTPSPAPPRQRRGSSATTQTAGSPKMSSAAQTASGPKISAAAQTASNPKMSAAAQTPPTLAAPTSVSPPVHSSPGASTAPSDWRQSVPRGRAVTAGVPLLTSPNPKATLDGGVRFRSPGRVPSLAYSTPNSASRRRTDLWRSPAPASSADWLSGAERCSCSIEPLSPPLYIPRPRSIPREPLCRERPPSTALWGRWASCSQWRPLVVAPAGMSTWRDRCYPNICTSHMTWNQREASNLSQWGDAPATAPRKEQPCQKDGGCRDDHHRSSRHRSRHHHRHSAQSCDGGRDGSEGKGVKAPPDRHGNSGVRESTPRDTSPQRRGDSRRRTGAERGEDGSVERRRSSGWRRRYHARQRREVYAPPVVPMGSSTGATPPSLSSREGSGRWSRSSSAGLLPHRSPRPLRPPVRVERKLTLGFPDAHSTMDLLTSVETLRAGDWFYKWASKGDSVHRRWVWIDAKSYLLVWSNYETHNPHFCGNVRLDQIRQVTSRDLSSVDKNGFPKTYYVLLIETRKRVLQLATELKEKCDTWFEALNNVISFIHRNDTANGALFPD
ncbi:hypothetical protein CUR178_03710 [Leishmania enriettii]|uniref:PH domain-containing protein n=1 Tax=Leishmania enriettii TaxID=5663 RepID=A0A836H1S0_LEIEN|nr:hypothetical protein CUR178_03710 [Leishmania enriettii]